MTIIQNDRQQSEVNMACRISIRLFVNSVTCSAGRLCKALNSADEMKLSKNADGNKAKSRAMPAVRAKLIISGKRKEEGGRRLLFPLESAVEVFSFLFPPFTFHLLSVLP